MQNFWYIEHDVCFSGDWHELFKKFDGNDASLITSNIGQISLNSDWYWL